MSSFPEVFLMFLKPCDSHTLHADVKLEWYENLLILLKLETKKTEQNIANMKPLSTSNEEPVPTGSAPHSSHTSATFQVALEVKFKTLLSFSLNT